MRDNSAVPTIEPPYRHCPACGGMLEPTPAESRRSRAARLPRLRLRVLPRSEGCGRHDHPRRRMTGSCSCGARSSPGTGCGCSPAGTSIAARRHGGGAARGARGGRSRRQARRAGQHLLVSRPADHHHRVYGVHPGRRTPHRRGVARGPALHPCGDSLDRSRIRQHPRRAEGLHGRADATSLQIAPNPKAQRQNRSRRALLLRQTPPKSRKPRWYTSGSLRLLLGRSPPDTHSGYAK